MFCLSGMSLFPFSPDLPACLLTYLWRFNGKVISSMALSQWSLFLYGHFPVTPSLNAPSKIVLFSLLLLYCVPIPFLREHLIALKISNKNKTKSYMIIYTLHYVNIRLFSIWKNISLSKSIGKNTKYSFKNCSWIQLLMYSLPFWKKVSVSFLLVGLLRGGTESHSFLYCAYVEMCLVHRRA